MTLDDAAIDELAIASDGYSFAYLRELFLSSMMRWISDGGNGAFAAVMLSQVTMLREPMAAQPEMALGAGAQAGGMGFGGPGLPPQIAARMFGGRMFGGGWSTIVR